MKIIHKKTGELCQSSQFNVSTTGEIIVCGEDWYDSDFIVNYDVILPDGSQKDLGQAFVDRDVLPNNYNTRFDYPESDEAKERGYNI